MPAASFGLVEVPLKRFFKKHHFSVFWLAPSLKWWCCRKVQFFLVSPILLWSNSTIPIAMLHSTVMLRSTLPKNLRTKSAFQFLTFFSEIKERTVSCGNRKNTINYKEQDDKPWKNKSLWKLFDVYAKLESLCDSRVCFWKVGHKPVLIYSDTTVWNCWNG